MTQTLSSVLDVPGECLKAYTYNMGLTGSDLHFRKITAGCGLEWGKRKGRETRGKVSETINNVQAKCCGGLPRGVLMEVKRNG